MTIAQTIAVWVATSSVGWFALAILASDGTLSQKLAQLGFLTAFVAVAMAIGVTLRGPV